MSESSSSKSLPNSLLPMPPSLFGSFSTPTASAKPLAPKKQGRIIPKKETRKSLQKPVAAPPKKKAQSKSQRSIPAESEEGSFEVSFTLTNGQDILEPAPRASSPSVITQSKRKTYKFSEGDTSESVPNEPETKSPDSSETKDKTSAKNHQNAPSSGVNDTNKSKEIDHSDENETTEDEANTDKDDEDDVDDETHADHLEAVIDRGLFQLPCTKGLVDTFSAGVKSYILIMLFGMLNEKPAPEVVLEIADSIDLLRLMGASDPKLNDIGKKMGEGVALYNKGMEKVNEGQDLLHSAIYDIVLLENQTDTDLIYSYIKSD